MLFGTGQDLVYIMANRKHGAIYVGVTELGKSRGLSSFELCSYSEREVIKQ